MGIFDINNLGGGGGRKAPVINPESVNPMKLCVSVVLHKIFQKTPKHKSGSRDVFDDVTIF